MYTLFILFFISLIGIVFMIGRKLAPVRNGEVEKQEYAHPFVPDVQKIKHLTLESLKKYEHAMLVVILRFYVRFSNFLKNTYEGLKTKVKNLRKSKNGNMSEETETKEASKFLRVISDYKQRVIHIKHRITEEENNK